MAIQNLRSGTANKRPVAGSMSDGQIALNTNSGSTGLFFKDASGNLIKAGPVSVGTSAPNSSPAGSSGNSVGEIWLDTTGGNYVIKIWDGSAWRSGGLTSSDIGVTVQGYDAGLQYLNNLNFTNEATFKTGVNLEIGVDVQAFDADTAKTDVAQTFTAGQRGEVTTLTDAANISTDLAASNNFQVTLAGNRTLDNPSNCTAGQSGSIFIVQDGTGSRLLAFGSYFDFAGGTAPTLSTAASAVDRIDYVVRSASSIHAVFTGNYS